MMATENSLDLTKNSLNLGFGLGPGYWGIIIRAAIKGRRPRPRSPTILSVSTKLEQHAMSYIKQIVLFVLIENEP
jgi:hypothetical protein